MLGAGRCKWCARAARGGFILTECVTCLNVVECTIQGQREALGEELFPRVLARAGAQAGKVTGLGALLAMAEGPPQLLDEAVAAALAKLERGPVDDLER